MNFSEKLAALRRREGLSQEQLANRLGVTRQSVSKWESGAATPELAKLVALADLFGVTLDNLVRDVPEASPDSLERKVDDLVRSIRGWSYAYDSPVRIFGLPLLSVRFSLGRRPPGREHVAKGVVAVGNAAVGVVAVGIVSAGLIGIGTATAGLAALGILAVGGLAMGVTAIGAAAFGVAALGRYAGGVAAVGREIAVGAAACGKTAVGADAAGDAVLLWGSGLSRSQVESFLLSRHPGLCRPLLRALSLLGAHIR